MIRLAINAGHGLYTPGKRMLKSIDPKETREWQLNSRIVEKVIQKMKAYEGYEILRTDDPTGKRDIPLAERTTNANNWKADFWLGVHHNAGINGGSGGGIVAYTQTLSQSVSKVYQKKLYDRLVMYTGLKGNRSQPLATANLHETRETKMPAVLLELGFMDSTVDGKMILTDEYAEKCANAIVDFYVTEFNLPKKVVPVPVPVPVEEKKDTILPDNKYFRVIVASTHSRNNAEAIQKQLKEKGFDSFLAIFEK